MGALAVLGCADVGLSPGGPGDVRGDAATSPGDYAVGLATIEVASVGGRQLPVAMWYPARPDAAGTAQPYYGVLPSVALRDAPVAEGGPWPVVLFSHAEHSIKEQSAFLVERLARAGYVVLAPDHLGDTVQEPLGGALPGTLRERPLDLRAVLDRLAAHRGSDPEWWVTKLDLAHVAAMGHSLGAVAALSLGGAALDLHALGAACASDPSGALCSRVDPRDLGPFDAGDTRVRAVVAMAPSGVAAFAEGALSTVTAPVLLLTGADDPLASTDVGEVYVSLTAPRWRWTLADAGHYVFTDFCAALTLVEPAVQAELGGTCGPQAPMPIGLAHDLVTDVVQSFLDAQLKGDPAAAARLTEAGAEAANPAIRMDVGP